MLEFIGLYGPLLHNIAITIRANFFVHLTHSVRQLRLFGETLGTINLTHPFYAPFHLKLRVTAAIYSLAGAGKCYFSIYASQDECMG